MQGKSIFLARNVIRNTFNGVSVLRYCISHSDNKDQYRLRNNFTKCWENVAPLLVLFLHSFKWAEERVYSSRFGQAKRDTEHVAYLNKQ